jgi:hypothetical protein
MLSAYLDDELSGDERADVEQLLNSSAAHRRVLSELEKLRAGIQSLPSHRLPVDFSQRVVELVEAGQAEPQPQAALPPTRRSPFAAWGAVAAVAAVAAALMLIINLPGRLPSGNTVAVNEGDPSTGVKSDKGKTRPRREPGAEGEADDRNREPVAPVTPAASPAQRTLLVQVRLESWKSRSDFETMLTVKSDLRFDEAVETSASLQQDLRESPAFHATAQQMAVITRPRAEVAYIHCQGGQLKRLLELVAADGQMSADVRDAQPAWRPMFDGVKRAAAESADRTRTFGVQKLMVEPEVSRRLQASLQGRDRATSDHTAIHEGDEVDAIIVYGVAPLDD